jgi:tetratricopeptide (TPR) repeat protein/predicted aspartyl protease
MNARKTASNARRKGIDLKTIGSYILAFCASLTLCLPTAALAESQCSVAKGELPITIAPGNRAVLTTKINGEDARFILDSGAFFNMMPMAAATQYHLPLRWAPMGFTITGIGGDARVQIGVAKELQMGEVKFRNVEFFIGGTDIQSNSVGLIGQNLLANWDVEYDMGHGRIALIRPQNCARGGWIAYWEPAGQASVLDIEAAHDARYHTMGTVKINGKDIKFTFDTGAQSSVLFRRGADKLGIKLDGPSVTDAGYGSGLGANRVKQYIVTLGSFKVSDLEEIKNSRIRVMDGNMGPNVYSKYESDMLLGADFILSHRILVSNSQHKMYISYNGGPVFNVTGPRPNSADAKTGVEAATTDGSPPPPGESLSALDFSRRGNASAARRDFDSAIADLTKACTLAPNDPEYFYQRALIYNQAGKADEALQDFDQVLKLKADFLPAFAPRARLRLAKHQPDEALADLDTADRLSPKEANLRFELSELYAEMRHYPAAISQLNLWLKSHDEDSRTGTALGERCRFKVYLNQDVASGLDDCSRAMHLEDKKEPRYASALAFRGLAYIRLGKLDRAMEDFDGAIKLQPKLAASAYYGRGLVEARHNRLQQSDADLAEARKLSPKIEEFYQPLDLKP